MADVKILYGGHSNGFQHFTEWFADAWKETGGDSICDIKLNRRLRAVLGRLLSFSVGRKRKQLLICGGFRIDTAAWPWCYFYEIIPMMWDLWPGNYGAFLSYIKRNHVRQVFCTSSQAVAYIQEHAPLVKVTWVPEGIDVNRVPMGERLRNRTLDIVNYGRRLNSVEVAIRSLSKEGAKYTFDGGKTFDELTSVIRSAKISICYPMCDTNPQKAGNVETLTQRYWEGMLSGTLICGRAPQELIKVCGYNPVVELSDKPMEMLRFVLSNIEQYQDLANRNRVTAVRLASWVSRMDEIRRELI